LCSEHCGVITRQPASSWQRPSSNYTSPDDLARLIGRPVKYATRMTSETRGGLVAAALVVKAAGWSTDEREVGLLAAGEDGSIHANERYFRDYVTSGRSMGRGNLFIYTLPTSTPGEIAIALSLRGPSIYLHDPTRPVAAIVDHALAMIRDGEADAMVALWSDAHAAVCLAIDDGDGEDALALPPDGSRLSPLDLARRLRATIVPS
jgi:3-oxoacyl-(acyl-carrier-protein) synthase